MLKDDYANFVRSGFQRTTYGKWLKDEGVAVYENWFVSDVWELDLAPWPRIGGRAVFITLYPMMEGQRGMYFAEIPAGRAMEPIKHLYEQIICVLDGHGTTEIWQEGDSGKHVFEWGRGSIFSPPLNTWYRMFNLGHDPVRFLAINRAPAAMNEFQNANFMFNCPYTFRERYDGQESYFTAAPKERKDSRGLWETNFILNAIQEDLDAAEWKASGGGITGFRLSGNQMVGHISQWPVGRYHKAHYHGAGALLLGLRSEGYVLLWPSAAGTQLYSSGRSNEVIEVPWGRGSLYSPPSEWFHQHFNTGAEPARHLAIRGGNPFSGAILGSNVLESNNNPTAIDIKEGGTLLEYEDEDPQVRLRYQEALRSKGVPFAMPEGIYERGYASTLGPQSRPAEWR